MRYLFLLLGMLLIWSFPATASWQQLTKCGAMEGQSYYFAGGAVPKNKSGWHKDGISKGSLSLLTDGKDLDIIFKDALQSGRSARFHDKATILTRYNKDSAAGLIVVFIFYKNTKSLVSEQYTFQLDANGNGIVLLSQQKDAVVSKSSLMAAKCSGAK